MSCCTKETMLLPSGDSSSGNDFVRVTVVTEGSDVGCERVFPSHLSVGQLRERLEILTGAHSTSMELELRSREGDELVAKLDNDHVTLGSCIIPKTGLVLKVIDPKLDLSEFTDVSRIEKLTISDDEYNKRNDSVRSFLKRQGVGKYSNQVQAVKILELNKDACYNTQEKVTECDIGQRCEVRLKGQLPKRGVIMYVGSVDFKPGTWAGIKYDEPVGKNDGSVGGKRYFECEPKYGGFVKPADVVVGDFPELGYDSQSTSSDGMPEEI